MPVPIITVSQMRQWEEATWEAGQTPEKVIEKVGQAVARLALRLTKPGEQILLLAGKGNNGADAIAAEPHLVDRTTFVLKVQDPVADLAQIRLRLGEHPALIIDGLFGIGLNRRLSDDWIKLIEAVNQSELKILSIDCPSGLNAELGETEGASIVADYTLAVGAPKRGFLNPRSVGYLGRLEIASDIGFVPMEWPSKFYWTTPSDFLDYPPERRCESHKGTYGHVVILGGSRGFHGAAVLATLGALRAQPGLVTLAVPETVYAPVAAQCKAAMVHAWEAPFVMPENCTALVAGPGLAGTEAERLFKNVVNEYWQDLPCPVLIDASALDWLKPGTTPLSSRRIITPHPGEAARMLQSTTELVQANRLAALRELSSRYGNCWVVLKGHQTIIGRSTGEIYFNPSGNPYLAQGGSGDLLAGYLGGLLAQPRLEADPLKALRYGTWQHGASADHLQARHRNWGLEELTQVLGDVSAKTCSL
jgi:hydroxyethylthiazole kinase-like uncharacterized protein yjeF